MNLIDADSNPRTRLLTLAVEHKREFERFIKFAVVGAFGAIVDFGTLNFLVLVVGLTPVWANPFSFIAAVISNFTWNRLWTFPESRERNVTSQLGKFALVNIIGLGINQIIFVIALNYAGAYLSTPWDYNLSKAIAIGIVLFWNFGANRLWTYKGL